MGIGGLFRGGKKRAQPVSAEFSGEKELPKEKKKKKKKKDVVDKDPMKTLKGRG